MSDKKAAEPFSLDQLLSADMTGIRYDNVPSYGGTTRIGSLPSDLMITWVEGNDDPVLKRLAGLRLLTMSVVDKTGARIPKEQWEAALEIFRLKDKMDNDRIIEAALRINGLSRAKLPDLEAPKNDLGGAQVGASPIVSASK